MARRGEDGFVIRISQDGRSDLYLRGVRNKVRVFQRMAFALDVVHEIRDTLTPAQHPSVVPVSPDTVPEEIWAQLDKE
jgi:hypothetical protein